MSYTPSAMAGPKGDPLDNYTNAIPFDTIPGYASYCKADGLKGFRLGIPRNIFTAPVNRTEADMQHITAFDAVIPILEGPGATVIDNADYPDIEAYNTQAQFDLALDVGFTYYGAKSFQNLTFNPTGITNVQELISWTMQFGPEQYPFRSVGLWQDGVGLLDSRVTIESPKYLQAIAHNGYLGSNATIQGGLDIYNLDALVLPTAYSVRPTVYAGYPCLTVPLRYFNSTPKVVNASFGALNSTAPGISFGLSFIGPGSGEAQIIQYAYAYEQATNYRY